MQVERKEMAPFQDLTEARKYFVDVALQAGKILVDHFGSSKLVAFEKSGVDFTTEADRQTDGFIQRLVKEQYPQATLLTEETAPENYSSLVNTENLVIVDPLDGTTNFSHNNTHFSISIALVDRGRSRVGVVYLPKEDRLYWAQEDIDQAFLNDKPVKGASKTSEFRRAVVGCDW